MTVTRISLAALALAALTLPALAQGGGFSAGMNSGGSGSPTIKMGKPNPEMVKKMKESRQKLMKELKLTPEQKKKWDATEAKYRTERSSLVKKLQGGGVNMDTIQQLQGIGEKEKKEKNAFLTPEQRKVLAAAPGGGSGMTIKTMGGPPK